MTLFGRNVLLVGQGFHSSRKLTDRLHAWNFRSHFAYSLEAAAELLSSRPVDLVLSNTYLPDGTGFSLLATVPNLPVTAFLCLPVENSCLWLPALDGGKKCLGLPALRPRQFARTLEEMARCLPT